MKFTKNNRTRYNKILEDTTLSELDRDKKIQDVIKSELDNNSRIYADFNANGISVPQWEDFKKNRKESESLLDEMILR